MKKLGYILILSTLFWSCGGSGGDTPPPPPPVNKAPTTPTLVYPTNNLLCIENPVLCEWNASTDPDGNVIRYQIEVAKDNSFTQDKQTFNGQLTTQSVSLEEDVAYYWRVKAVDSENASSSYSSVFKFYTYGEGVTNYLPFTPELVSPELNVVVQESAYTPNEQLNVILQWTAEDVDTSDTLTFDVYFGTVNPPSLNNEHSNLSSNTLNVSLEISTTYYWKVVVKDGQGGETIGQIWSFNTD
ncbi:MAG: hypothetical protein COC16_00435 [Lutibacter sp.]|nr:MAG: hypothetical protein COC16_00435 [Lutibacter sp.]